MADPDRLCLLQVHAHPDDEASKGAGTTAKYAAEGVHAVLVCCTGGEAGDILNPAVDTPETRANLYAVRMAELQASVDALGYASLHLLGYHDSGMPDSETNARPDNFANAPLDEAVERFVRIIRAERPQVIITYRDEQNFYPHPDHIRVHQISGPAFDAAGDPDALSRCRRPVAAVEALLRLVVDRPGEGVACDVPGRVARKARTRHGLNVASTPTAKTSSRPSSTSATSSPNAARRSSHTAPRSIPRVTGCASPMTSCARCSRGKSSRWSVRWSTTAYRTANSKMTCSQGYGPERSIVPEIVVEFVVAAAKKEQARGWVRVDGAAVVERGSGAAPEPADVTFTATPADAQAMHDGTLDLSVGFMRGQVKMAGDFGALLQFLAVHRRYATAARGR